VKIVVSNAVWHIIFCSCVKLHYMMSLRTITQNFNINNLSHFSICLVKFSSIIFSNTETTFKIFSALITSAKEDM